MIDLRAPPVDVNQAVYGVSGASDGSNPMSSLLGSVLGGSPAESKARIEEASKNANDITGLVRRKKDKSNEGYTIKTENTNGKRKANDEAEGESKKARVTDVPEK